MKKRKDAASLVKNLDKEIKRFKAKGREIPEEILKEYNYFRMLLDITRSINTLQDFKKVLELIVDSAMILTQAERGFLMLFSKDGNLEFEVTRNIIKKTLEAEELKISRTIVNQVLATSKPVFLSNIYRDKKFEISKSIEVLGLHMVMCVPLKTKKHLLGVIYVDSHEEVEKFTETKENIFEAFAAQASIAIENSYLYDSSVRDALTGLYNYGYLRSRLEEEITRASRYKKEMISFMMLDFDNFKAINDSYGHIFGNSILVKVADLIKHSVRKYDIPARYGGDEFAILMPGADEQDAQYLAKRLQNEISALQFIVGKETVSISVSVGISSFPVETIIDSENIIVEADHALFIAKGKGKNQIVIYGLHREEKKRDFILIGKSKMLSELKKTISRFARTDATVLIIGETGTGKELITHVIHQESSRADKPFVVVNCGAIPDNLIESELFGYEKGAFTGAYRQHKGKFESAQGGTIFLDEIGELPLHLQVKIMRAIDQKEIDRVGGETPVKVDVRVIAATNKDLEEEVKKGNFRKDLFYRLSVATIYVPSLRERPEDIETISTHYLIQMNKRYQRQFIGFTKSAMDVMFHHPWHGNVRELFHRIERAVIMGMGTHLDETDLGLMPSEREKVKPLKQAKKELEIKSVTQGLAQNAWNISHTAKALGITRKTLKDLIKKYKILKSD
jgi:diguanylate cyclase (GGDEF)-like protein